jgi:hypothetical protein
MPPAWSQGRLSPDEAERALGEWFGFALPGQYPLGGAAANWLVLGGRGSGKTRLGSEWVNALVRGLPPYAKAGMRYGRIALVGETLGDAREVMIEGPSGIRASARGERPHYEPSRRRLVWGNGAVAQAFSAEDPESLRGPQFDAAWCDEIGAPAADKGANQPNVFPDAKSTENAVPYFSNEGRSDLAQLRFLTAHMDHWDPASLSFDATKNPDSPVYGGRMVDPAQIHVWAWDARPFPAFPRMSEVWADAANWHRGHWLNGRLEGIELGALIDAILADHGLEVADVEAADGTAHAYVIDEPCSARQALEPLTGLFDLAVTEGADGLAFRRAGANVAAPLALTERVLEDDGPTTETLRTPPHELPAEALLAFRDPLQDYQTATARARRLGAQGSRQESLGFAGVLESGQGEALAQDWLQRTWSGRETASFAVASYREGMEPGALITLPDAPPDERWIVTEIEDGLVRRVKARRLERAAPAPWLPSNSGAMAPLSLRAGKPHALLIDLPSRSSAGQPQDQHRLAVWQKPWKTQAVYASPEATGYTARTTIERAASLGTLAAPLPPGFAGRVHRTGFILASLYDAEVASVSRLQLLNGANAAAIRSASGAWEIVQFETAEEIAPDLWRLSGLLRGQLGTEDAMAAGSAAGADIVMIDEALKPAGLAAGEIGLPLNWRIGPTGAEFSTAYFAEIAATGGIRARLPLSPVHLRCRKTIGGDLALTWIRRGRLDADDWAGTDIPLGEEREEYRVEIAPAGGATVRTATAAVQSYVYAAASIAADFGTPPASIDVTVRQLSLAAGWGLPTTRRFTL